MPPRHVPAIDRIGGRISVEPRGHQTDCWIYAGHLDRRGYGKIGVRLSPNVWTMKFAHRVVYEHRVGKVPEGLELDHLCRQHACCNPAHLEAVTHRENIMRGTCPEVTRARHANKTHCDKGHELSGENLYIKPGSGTRNCRTCRRAVKRAWRQKVAANGR